MLHNLKCEERWFDPASQGIKPFEIRKDDRGFNAGDHIVMICGDRLLCAWVPYVMRDSDYLPEGYVAISMNYRFHVPLLKVRCLYDGKEQTLWIPAGLGSFTSMAILEVLEKRISE